MSIISRIIMCRVRVIHLLLSSFLLSMRVRVRIIRRISFRIILMMCPRMRIIMSVPVV